MAFQSNRPPIQLTVQPEHPAFLEGLDLWLRLGLLSDEQVRRLCQEHLVCPLPLPALAATPQRSPTDFVPDFVPEPPRQTRTRSRQTSGVLQSFMTEVSVLWLLFLGVFMVVVSSAVLAASQWRNFSPVVQYGILFGYTLVFGGISVWAGRQPNLQLTARMLRVTTLLIIPVNFWMMDGFRLWSSGLGWVVAAIAALTLSAILISLLRPSLTSARNPRLMIANSIGLSWLHWGWSLAGFPLIATYVGTIGTALVLFYQSEERGVRSEELNDSPNASFPVRTQVPLSLGTIAIAFATLLLVGRAVLVAQVPPSKLGLALGICGWLLCWLSRRDSAQEIWTKAGLILLLAGWLVSVLTIPEQALAVSGLGLWLLADRLQRLRQVQDLTALFLVGLQSGWLLWRVLPEGWRQGIITFSIQLAGNQFMPQALIGLGLFPYVVLTVLLAAVLRQRQQPKLALHAEGMALVLGLVLTLISFFNPLIRAINLLLSFLTLIFVVGRRIQAEITLIYLTHIAGLTTIGAWIYFARPNLSVNAWVGILLGGMLAEWLFSISSRWQQWRRSSWHLGLVLAALSYTLLFSPNLNEPTPWYLAWFITPVAIALLSYHPNFPQPRLANALSIAALLIIQPLTLNSATARLASLGVGTLAMLLNTQRLQEVVAAALTVGWGLGLSFAIVWQVFSERMTVGWWVSALAIASLLLWLLRSGLSRGGSRLHRIYAQATDGWAIVLTIPTLTFLTGYNVSAYSSTLTTVREFVVAAAVLTLALAYRTWQQPTNWSYYGLGFAVELLVASLIAANNRSLDGLAIATLALGLFAQLAGDWRIIMSQSAYFSSWHVIPLLYAILGLVLAHHEFKAYTGLYTLAAALVGIGIGRRHELFKPVSYLSLLGISVAAYELLIYQLMQAKEGSAGDGIVLLAALAAAIAIGERLLSRWLLPYLRLNRFELRTIAHLHWVGGSGLILFALTYPLSNPGERLWMGVTAILATYAFIQGRSIENWTYAGIVEAGIALGYGLHLVLPKTVLQSWSAAIACMFAFILYILPWATWGWSARPWRRSATFLPGIIVLLTSWNITIQSLLIVGAFYAWLAKAESKIRISYFSILLADWAILRILSDQSVTEPLWYALLGGSSLLYIAQVDPQLQLQSEREKRHLLRSLATGLICFTALYQAEIGIQGLSPLLLGFLTVGLGFIFILAGIALRVRAFLYLGTITFMVSVLRQIWLFINDYSLFLWAVGIVMGSLLIWIALTFEARRSQAIALVQYWLTELDRWE